MVPRNSLAPEAWREIPTGYVSCATVYLNMGTFLYQLLIQVIIIFRDMGLGVSSLFFGNLRATGILIVECIDEPRICIRKCLLRYLLAVESFDTFRSAVGSFFFFFGGGVFWESS